MIKSTAMEYSHGMMVKYVMDQKYLIVRGEDFLRYINIEESTRIK
jgi:hypothetical protein